ncbi:GIY-YIG nuclease family protein [Spirosoma litoris]
MKNNISEGAIRKSGVYQILNIVNGKYYIGSTYKFKYRIRDHERKLENGTHPNKYLNLAYKKYGPDAFEVNLLELVDLTNQPYDLLTDTEDKYIKLYNATNRIYGYNMSEVAKSRLGSKLDEETKARMRGKKMPANHPFRAKRFGEAHPAAKLTTEIAIEIKLMLAKGCRIVNIANYFNVPQSDIFNIKNGVAWQMTLITQEQIDKYNVPDISTKKHFEDQRVKLIKYLSSLGESPRVIAEYFDYSEATVFRIGRNETYSHIQLSNQDFEFFNQSIPRSFLDEAKERVRIRAHFNKSNAQRETNKFSALSEQDVILIKELLNDNLSIKEIAQRFNVFQETISKIRKGQLWAFVTGFNMSKEGKIEKKPVPFGQNSKSAKLNNEKVLKIKESIDKGETYASIGRQFEVDSSLIGLIAKGKAWSHVTGINS